MEGSSAYHAQGSCIRILQLPFTKLTSQDIKLLESVHNTLCGHDQATVVSACSFISSSVSSDYPPEIFLQKPRIIFALLNLLTVPLQEDSCSHLVHAAQCLETITRGLHRRILSFLHPDLFCSKEDGIFLQRSIGASDNFLDYLQPYSAANETENELAFPLQRLHTEGCVSTAEYLTLPRFCSMVMRTLVPLLRESSVHCFVAVHKTLLSTLCLLNEIVRPGVFSEANVQTSTLGEDLKACVQELEICMAFYSRKKLMNEEFVDARLRYTAVVILTSRFLNVVVGVNDSSQVLPAFLKKALKDVVMDNAFENAHPAVHSNLLQYVLLDDVTFKDTYKLKEFLAASVMSAQKFFKMSQSSVNSNDLIMFYSLFVDALPCLPYLPNLNIIQQFLIAYSIMFTYSDEASNSVAQDALLQLLKHWDVRVRQEAWECCVHIVQNALPSDSASAIPDSKLQRIQFALQQDIIACIVTCGLNMRDKNTSVLCVTWLASLLHSRWLLSPNSWKKILSCLLPVYPLLQCFAHADVTLSSDVLVLGNPDTLNGVILLSTLDCLKSNLRDLFCVNDKVKESALRYLLRLCIPQGISSTSSQQPQNCSDFTNIVEVFHSHASSDGFFSVRKVNATEEPDNLKSLLMVAGNSTMDSDVRASCLHQISFLVEDKTVHRHFENIGGDDIVMKIVVDFADKTDRGFTRSSDILVDALKIMRARLLLSCEFRSYLSEDEPACLAILRCFFQQNDSRVIALFPMIFAAIAFHRFISVKIMDDKYEVCLPAVFLERLHFPFAVSSWDQRSEGGNMKSHETTILDTKTLSSQCLFLWHLKWYGGVQGLAEALRDDDALQKGPFFNVLKEGVDMISITCPQLCSMKLLVNLCNATSHSEALNAVFHLCIVIRTASSQVHNVWDVSLWKSALNRFLLLVPTSSEDAELLSGVFSLLEAVLLTGSVPVQMFEWMWHTVLLQHGPCKHIVLNLQHLSALGDQRDSFRLLANTLLKFLRYLFARSESRLPKEAESLIGDLGAAVSITEIYQPHNLVLLQNILCCLHQALHRPVGAKMPVSWDRLLQLLSPLIEMVVAFYHGPEKQHGVHVGLKATQLAVLCLHQLAERMSTVGPCQWEKYWLQHQCKSGGEINLGLTWILPLWTDPEPQIRAAGLGIAVGLTHSNYGQELLTAHLQQLVGGLWGVTLSFLIDHEEASIVREEAALLLCNLTSKLANKVAPWQSLIAKNIDSKVPLHKDSGLLALFQQCNFYEEISNLIVCYYPHSRLDNTDTDLADGVHHVNDAENITELMLGQHGVCSASLLGVVCQLLQNLVILYPEQAIPEISNHQLHLLCLRYILSDPSLSTSITVEKLQAVQEIVKLLTLCTLHSDSIRLQLLQCGGSFVKSFFCLRKTSGFPKVFCNEIWKLLAVLLEHEGVKAYEVILMCITFHWDHMRESLVDLLDSSSSSEECGPFLIVLCQLCSYNYKSECAVFDQLCFMSLLDTALFPLEPHSEVSERKEGSAVTTGKHIATVLMRKLNCPSFVRHERNAELELLIAALSSVLSTSQTAKQSPSHVEFLELLMNDINCLSDAVKECKTRSTGMQSASKSTNIVYALEQRFELLQNAVFDSPASKEFCCSHGLLLVILQSWWFIAGKASLLTSCLRLLLNLTANCVSACQSIIRLCTIPGGTTLSHHLVQLAQKNMKEMLKGKDVICNLVFGIICNLSLTDDLWKFLSKVNFLEQCVTLLSDSDIKKGQLQQPQFVWLKMMITLTYSSEGQKLVAATKGVLTLLCEWATPDDDVSHEVRWHSMLVLRNLCFLQANKGKLLATGTFLKSLQLQLEENTTEKQWLIAGSTLWALLANSEKAKALIRANKILCSKLYEVHRIIQLRDKDNNCEMVHVFQSISRILEKR